MNGHSTDVSYILSFSAGRKHALGAILLKMSNALPSYLALPPDNHPAPPVETRVQLLPFDQLSWENFERLCLRIAKRVDRAVEASLYGTPGQDQDGIDLFGKTAANTTFVYQSRRVKAISASQVAQAVRDFASGGRPYNANRFVLCVAVSARSTAVRDALEDCRQNYRDFAIDIYDQEELSSFLKHEPDLVDEFFGAAWRSSFCSTPAPANTQSSAASSISPDMLLRGPLVALGLQSDLEHAHAIDDRSEAANIYQRISNTLQERGFNGHAGLFRAKQAQALIAAGAVAAAYEIWLDQAATEIDDGALSVGPQFQHELEQHVGHVNDVLQARYRALLGVSAWYEAPAMGLKALSESLALLDEACDIWAPRVALWLAEAALVDNLDDENARSSTRATLERLSPRAPEAIRIRMRLAAAELGDQWAEVLRDATTGRLAPVDAGLVFSRYGRWRAFSGEADESVDEYRRSIEKLSQSPWLGDAADALHAIAAVRQLYGPLGTELDEAHRLARDLSGQPRRISGRQDVRASGLYLLSQDKLPDALRHLRRNVWQCRLAGNLGAEIDARKLLGDVYSAAGDYTGAIIQYIWAGNGTNAGRSAASSAPMMNLEAYLLVKAPWMLATVLEVIAKQGDRMRASDVEAILPRVMELTRGVRQGGIGPQVGPNAWKALAGMARLLPDSAVPAVLDLIEPRIPREEDHYTYMDESLAVLLGYCYERVPAVHRRAADDLANSLEYYSLGYELVDYLPEVVQSDTYLQASVRMLADSGNRLAIRVLAFAGLSHPHVLEEARDRVEDVLSFDPDEDRNEWGIGDGFHDAAVYARMLSQPQQAEIVRHLIRIGESTKVPEASRASAVAGMIELAASLSSALGEELFERVLSLTDPNTTVSSLDQMMRASLHPLSRFRIGFGVGTLARAAIVAAARLATSADQAEQTMAIAIPWLQSSHSEVVAAASRAIVALADPIRPPLDVAQLAAHPAPAVRKVAAYLWARDPLAADTIGLNLASDDKLGVRRQLAAELGTVRTVRPGDYENIREHLRHDVNATVRDAVTQSGQEQ